MNELVVGEITKQDHPLYRLIGTGRYRIR
jgi:hypothetical protein